MTSFTCARALRVCALLALPASAVAQSPRSPTIFSPTTQLGTVNVRAAVVLADYTAKPLPLLNVVVRRADRPDSVSAQTDLDGRVTLSLRVGTYTLRAKTAQPIGGKSYAWNVQVTVRPSRTELVQLTNANAAIDSVAASTTVAAAPAAPPTAAEPARPVTTTPKPVPSEKVVAVQKPVPSEKAVAVQKPAPVQKKVVDAPVSAPPASTASETPRVERSPVAPTTQPGVNAPAPTRAAVRAMPAEPRANTSKLLLGLSFDASGIKSEALSASTETGAGMGAQLGWGFTKNFALILDASAARITSVSGDIDLAHVDVGGRWHFVRARSGFVPFVEVGYAGRAATKPGAIMFDGAGNMYTGDLSILGGGVSLGGGVQYFVTPTWALGGALKWTTGQFSRVQFDDVTVDHLAIAATSARFNMGFTWVPMGR